MLQPTEISDDAVLLTVPNVPQDELHACGLASISALCEFHDVEIPSADRASLTELAEEHEGISGAELRGVLENVGMEVFIFPGTLDHSVSGLYRHVDRGRPALVMISVEESRHHYCLFTGYDPTHGNVFLMDPRRGRLVLPTTVFESLWERSDRFTLLCLPEPSGSEDPTSKPPKRSNT